MKVSVLFSLALVASLSALATETANMIGVLRVDSSEAETIVSVPWVATSAASTDAAIPVTDIVKTANLSEGDELYYYNSSTAKYQCWKLNASKEWEAANDVGGEDALSDSTLARGGAIILKRGESRQDHFFLQGQVAATGSSTATMTRSESAEAWSLIAPPTTNAVCVNAGTWANVAAGDRIVVEGLPLEYKDGKWGTYATNPTTFTKTFNATTANIAIGHGAWYKSASGATAATVTWSGLPTVK